MTKEKAPKRFVLARQASLIKEETERSGGNQINLAPASHEPSAIRVWHHHLRLLRRAVVDH